MSVSSKTRLDAVVRNRFQVSWGKARGYIETGKIFVDGIAMTDEGALVDESVNIELKMNAPKPGTLQAKVAGLSRSEIVFVDTQLIVINKPAGLNSVPYEDEKDSLESRACKFLGQPKLFVVHRLDRDTSGLIVFARNREAEKALSNLFRFHTIQRRYFALAHGQVKSQTIRSELVENRGDGLRGSLQAGDRISRDLAKSAVTHVRALHSFNGMTLVECVLETGRTHQIRIHLSEAGHPLVGERAYIREYRGAKIEAPRIMLHAAELGFVHPTQSVPMSWRVVPPEDFLKMLDRRGKELVAFES